MTTISKQAALVCCALLLVASAASAASVATAKNGMTLYTYDKDKSGVPSCYGLCAFAWPAYIGHTGEKMGKGWTLVHRKGTSLQWAYHNKPAYFYAPDSKKGDMKGDGSGGVWHVFKD
jgi:predicted lipoprotein with Yx(FWY)xxD motif